MASSTRASEMVEHEGFAAVADFADELEAEPLHDRSGAPVASLGERDHLGRVQLVKSKGQACPADLTSQAVPPESPAERPPDLQLARAVYLGIGQTPSPDQLTGPAIVGKPFMNTFASPGAAHRRGGLIGIFGGPRPSIPMRD